MFKNHKLNCLCCICKVLRSETSGNNHAWAKKSNAKSIRRKISITLKGNIPWNKGLLHSEEVKQKISNSLKGHIPWNKGKKLPEQYIKNAMRRRIPSSLEEKFMKIIEKYNLPYVYVGDGSFILDNCNPDFININGQKIVIEVYCRFYKQLGNRNIEDWKKKRIGIFKKYGWRIFFFDEIALNKEENVLNILGV